MQVLRPSSVSEALEVLTERDDEAKVIAGGTAVMLMLRNGLIFPDVLISLERVSGLDYLEFAANEVRIGGLTTLRTLQHDAQFADRLPTLSQALSLVANHRIRHRATIGGNVCEADYASDPPAILAMLGARVVLRSLRGERQVHLKDFLLDYYTTAIEHDELAVALVVPTPAEGSRTRYVKFVSRTSEDRPCIGVAAMLRLGVDGRCADVDVQVAGATATPFSSPEALGECVGEPVDGELWRHLADAYATRIPAIEDVRGSSSYRKKADGRLLERTMVELVNSRVGGLGSTALNGAVRL